MFKIGDRVIDTLVDTLVMNRGIGIIEKIDAKDIMWVKWSNGNHSWRWLGEIIKIEEPNDIMKELCSK